MSTATEELEELDRRVNDLRGFEREYRGRLRAHLTGLLNDLNYADEENRPRQEILGPEWSLLVPGWEFRANGNGVNGRVCIEIRKADPS